MGFCVSCKYLKNSHYGTIAFMQKYVHRLYLNSPPTVFCVTFGAKKYFERPISHILFLLYKTSFQDSSNDLAHWTHCFNCYFYLIVEINDDLMHETFWFCTLIALCCTFATKLEQYDVWNQNRYQNDVIWTNLFYFNLNKNLFWTHIANVWIPQGNLIETSKVLTLFSNGVVHFRQNWDKRT